MFSNKAPPTELLNRLRSRQKRWYKKLLRLKSQNKLSLETGLYKLKPLEETNELFLL